MTLANLRYFPRLPLEDAEGRTAPGESASCVACVAMRDEALNAHACIQALLCQPEIRCIVVADDESSDGTSRILQRIAQQTPRVVLVSRLASSRTRNAKCAALAAAAYYAQSLGPRYLLFVDADVRVEAGTVDALLQYARRTRAQAVSAWPRIAASSGWDELFAPLVTLLLVQCLPMWASTRTKLAAAGNGQLFLVERSAYERSGGHAAIDSVVEDVALAKALTRSGSRVALASAAELAAVIGYGSLQANVMGYGRSLYAGAGIAGCLAFALWQIFGFAGSFVALPFAPQIAICGIAAAFGARLLLAQRMNEPLAVAVRWPLAAFASAVGAFAAAWLGTRGRLTWRGRSVR